MSHFTKIKTKLYNLETLKRSLSDLNIEWASEKQEITGYKEQKQVVELVVTQKNNYDLGFKWNGNEYEPKITCDINDLFENHNNEDIKFLNTQFSYLKNSSQISHICKFENRLVN